MSSRTAFIPPDRLAGWIRRFEASHGSLRRDTAVPGLVLVAADGAAADLRAPWPEDGRPGTGAEDVARLASVAGQSRTVGLILLRRGGYAVGVARDGELHVHKTGTRHVQSRSAAGGSSQQRFARRRANQAGALLDTVAATVNRLFAGQRPEYLALGGDRTLAEDLIRIPQLRAVAALTRLDPLDVPDPRLRVLVQAARDVACIRITVTDPAADSSGFGAHEPG